MCRYCGAELNSGGYGVCASCHREEREESEEYDDIFDEED